MAAVALNTFKTIRHNLTTSTVGIYTAPIGVASIIVSAQIANVSTGTTTYLSTFFIIVLMVESLIWLKMGIPVKDALSPLAGRLVLETDDEIRVSANENGVLQLTMSVLETAKG